MSPPSRDGVCGTLGWAPLGGTGPNCTYVGRRAWGGGALMLGSCARNVRKALETHTEEWITSLLQQHADSGVLVFEDRQRSGDPDGTRARLVDWATRDERVRLILAAPLLYPVWSRTQRLALCRNMLMHEAVRQLPRHGFLVALDLDCRAAPVAQLSAALGSAAAWRRWDVLTTNSPPSGWYYDRWALRSSTKLTRLMESIAGS